MRMVRADEVGLFVDRTTSCILAGILVMGCQGSPAADAGWPRILDSGRRVDAGPEEVEQDDAGADATVSDAGVDGGADAGPACSDVGCDPLDPEACGSQSCLPLSPDSPWSCVSTFGASGVGERCGSLGECQRGLLCTSFSDSFFRCRTICGRDADCEAGQTCAALGNFGHACAGACLATHECDPLTQDCASDSEMCSVYYDTRTELLHTICIPRGGSGEYAYCTRQSICRAGTICVPSYSQCRRVCRFSSDCTGSDTCTGDYHGLRYCN